MNTPGYSDEVLSAWIDGELDEALREEIAVAVETDPALAGRIAAVQNADFVLRGAFDEDLKEGLQLREPAGNVVAFPRRLVSREWMRIAATGLIALATGAGAMQLLPGRGQDDPLVASGNGLEAGSTLAAALTRARSGTEERFGAAVLTVATTFRAGDNRYCREVHIDFPTQSADAVACREQARWHIEGWTAAPRKSSGIETAGGPDNGLLGGVLKHLGTQKLLDGAEEARAIREDWK